MKFSVNQVKQGLGELQTTLHWGVAITSPAAVVGEFPEDLEVRVQTTAMPEADVQTTKIELGGHTINFNGKTIKAGELPWKFIEGTDAAVISYFTQWANARWGGDGSDTTGKSALTAECKADVVIQLMNPQDEVVQTYKLIGALPKIATSDELGQTADPLSPIVTWEYDDFHVITDNVSW